MTAARKRKDAALRQKQFRLMAAGFVAAEPLIDDAKLQEMLVKRGASKEEALDAILNMAFVR